MGSSDPWMRSTTLAEDVYLMRYTEAAAWFRGPYLLEAAVLIELIMSGFVELTSRGRLIVWYTGTGNPILDAGLNELRRRPEAFRTSDVRFRHAGIDLVQALCAVCHPGTEKQIVAALARKGIVERRSRRSLLVFTLSRVVLTDQAAADRRRSAVLDIAQADRPSVRAANLAALAGLPTPETVDLVAARAVRCAAVRARIDLENPGP